MSESHSMISLAELKTKCSDSLKHIYYSKPNASSLYSIYLHFCKRSYEEPYNWYYLVFKPYNDTYSVLTYAKGLNKTGDYLRNKVTAGLGILSREIESEKIHINALMCVPDDLTEWHNKNCYFKGLKYKLYVQKLDTYEHRINVLAYMFKEANDRDFVLYLDHMSFEKNKKQVTKLSDELCKDDPDKLVLTKRLF